MLKIRIFTFGKARQQFIKQAEAEYLDRLKHYAKLEIVELKDEEIKNLSEQELKRREAETLIRASANERPLLLLDRSGKQFSSEEFAAFLERYMVQGTSKISFSIGGALGFSEEILKQADSLISLSRFTFPHQLVRVILLEQIYRAMTIIKGEPYHK